MWRAPGDGWVTCEQGHRHWGTYGAAGLLVTGRDADGHRRVLLQHRAAWTHQGDTWGLAGGARRPEETAEQAALREAGEETGLRAEAVRASAISSDEHGGWSYATVVAQAETGDPEEWEDLAHLEDLTRLEAAHARHETEDLAWVEVERVEGMRLHPGFRQTWPQVRRTLEPATLLVDAANVVGSRPNGWWRDRVGATRSLLRELTALARRGIEPSAAPWESPALLQVWFPRIVVVVEGQVARSAQVAAGAAGPDQEGSGELGRYLELRRAGTPGHGATGDDELHRQAARTTSPTVAVTADRGLRTRLAEVGVSAVGPRWLWDLLDDAGRRP